MKAIPTIVIFSIITMYLSLQIYAEDTLYFAQSNKIRPIPVNKTNTKTDHDPQSEKNKLINRLTLSNNNLSSIPNYIYSYINLEYLDLSNNNLTSIPEDIKLLTKLKEIRLSNNKFVN